MRIFSRNTVFLAAVWVSTLFTIVFSEICEVRLDCPTNYDTVEVARNTVMLSSFFNHCAPDYFDESFTPGQQDTVSLFFVVDHSLSMTVQDSSDYRYEVMEQIIDSLAELSPVSEVGIAVFSNQLMHNFQDDPYYVQLDPQSGWHDSYIPLTKLDTTIDGMNAVEKLKEAVALSENKDPNWNARTLINGDYGSTGRTNERSGLTAEGYVGTTDVTLGMDAARHAFQSASYSADRQYVIFLSDGEAQHVDEERSSFIDDYMKGENLPTTYTAYFINQSKMIPQEMKTMTESIQQNGYSTNNTKTEIWKQSGRELDLMSKILNLTVGSGPQLYPSTPLSMTINGVTTTDFDDSLAYFENPFALQGEATQFEVDYTWRIDKPTPEEDSVRTLVTVVQSDDPDLQSWRCWEQGTLELWYQGAQIDRVEEDMTRLEVRFYPQESVSGVTVDGGNSSRTDSLEIDLTNNGDYWSELFDREYGSPVADNIIQTENGDSLVLVYRNPDIPLDTVRLAVPVAVQRNMALRQAYLIDRNSNGHPDLIRVIQGEEKIAAEDCSTLVKAVAVQTQRSFSVESITPDADGFLISLDEEGDDVTPNTGVEQDERLLISRSSLESGGTLPSTDKALIDSMAPVLVNASYLDYSEVEDTVVVTFSEPIDQIYSSNPLLFHRLEETYSLHLEYVESSGSQVKFSVTQTAGQMSAQRGDSVNIDVNASVSDAMINIQSNEDNPLVLLEYQVINRATQAVYHDTDNDGYIDIISIKTDRVPDDLTLKAFKEAVDLPEFRNFVYSSEDFVVTDSGFNINVEQENVDPVTDIDGRDVVVVDSVGTDDVLIVPSRLKVKDRIAPVITRALFIPAIEESLNRDTLVVTFSEEVDLPSTPSPFLFSSGDDTYSMELVYDGKKGNNEYVFSVTDIVDKDFPEAGDSVCIDPEAGLEDLNGNVQNEPNRKVVLEVKAQDHKFRVVTSANPFDPDNPAIPSSVRSYYSISTQEGMVVVAEPLTRATKSVDLKGKMIIYDATGNIVVKLNGRRSAGNSLVYIWNGRNRNGREVGSGVYLSIIEITDSEGDSSYIRKKIGISRKPNDL
ncbi:MAG: hypothetical protein ACLFVE_00535 [Chitinispirillaceae bacterium]